MTDPLPDWMKPADVRILEILAGTQQAKVGGLWLKAATIAQNVDLNPNYVGRRCRTLAEHDLIDKEGDYYRIKDSGAAYVTKQN